MLCTIHSASDNMVSNYYNNIRVKTIMYLYCVNNMNSHNSTINCSKTFPLFNKCNRTEQNSYFVIH